MACMSNPGSWGRWGGSRANGWFWQTSGMRQTPANPPGHADGMLPTWLTALRAAPALPARVMRESNPRLLSASPLQAPKGKKVAAAPSAVKKAAAPAKPVNPLYEKRPKTFSACRCPPAGRGCRGGGSGSAASRRCDAAGTAWTPLLLLLLLLHVLIASLLIGGPQALAATCP